VRSRYARVGRDPAVGQCILLAGNVGAEEGRHSAILHRLQTVEPKHQGRGGAVAPYSRSASRLWDCPSVFVDGLEIRLLADPDGPGVQTPHRVSDARRGNISVPSDAIRAKKRAGHVPKTYDTGVGKTSGEVSSCVPRRHHRVL
jgi:hypothetical protein